MKTKIFLKMAVTAAILLAFIIAPGFAPLTKKAPTWPCGSPYSISNLTPCDLSVTYQIKCNGTPCFSTTIPLSTGATFNIPLGQRSCAASCSNCDVQVSFSYPGTPPTFFGTVNFNNPAATFTGFCASNGGNITWTSTNTTIQ